MVNGEPPPTPDAAAEARAYYIVRVWLPDRPGALGHVASRIGAVGGDVLGIDVVDRGGGRAIDELTIHLPTSRVELLIREANAVDGVDVEEVREVARAPGDPRLIALEVSTRIVRATSRAALHDLLCTSVAGLLHADWSAVTRPDDGSLFCTLGAVPTEDWLVAFSRGAGCAVAEGTASTDGDEVAWSPLRGLDRLLIVGRDTAGFSEGEIAIVAAMAELAATRLHELSRFADQSAEAVASTSARPA
jgi:hypothetical protein